MGDQEKEMRVRRGWKKKRYEKEKEEVIETAERIRSREEVGGREREQRGGKRSEERKM